MNFKKLFLIIKKNFKFILVFTILVIIAALFFSWYASGGYDVSVSLSIFSKVNQPTQDYQYDGYWSVKASSEFGDTVQQWVKSPEIVSAIYEKASVPLPDKPLSSFFGIIKAKKMAPNYVETSFRAGDTSQAESVARALTSVLQEKASVASQYSGNAVFTILGGEPVIVKNRANFIFNGFVALLGGFLLAIFIVLLKEDDNWS